MAPIAEVPLDAAAPLQRTGAGPVLKWAGGKRSLWRQLLPLAPRSFATYFEPFLGGGAFFLALGPSHAILGDANCELIQVYEAIRDDPALVMDELDIMQGHVLDPNYYYATRAVLPQSLSPARRAARFIYLNKTCYNGLYRVNRTGQFNVPFGRYSNPPSLYNRENMLHVTQLLSSAELSCADFSALLGRAGAGDFAYLDPPYVPVSTTASFTRYTADAFGEAEQRRLASTVEALSSRGCRVLLSNSDTPLVRELYPSSAYTVNVVYAPRNINSDSAGRQKVTELAIRNYDSM